MNIYDISQCAPRERYLGTVTGENETDAIKSASLLFDQPIDNLWADERADPTYSASGRRTARQIFGGAR